MWNVVAHTQTHMGGHQSEFDRPPQAPVANAHIWSVAKLRELSITQNIETRNFKSSSTSLAPSQRAQNDNMSVAPNIIDETTMNDTIDSPKTSQFPATVSIASALRKSAYRLYFSCDHTGRYRRHTKRQIQW